MDRKHQYVEGLIEDVSSGAFEERMIEATGDADVGRRFRGGGRHRGRRHGGAGRRGVNRQPASPEAQQAKDAIRRQLPSKVVSEALVKKWASASAGASSGPAYDKLCSRMKRCIERRGAQVSADKSETAGAGDFVGWA